MAIRRGQTPLSRVHQRIQQIAHAQLSRTRQIQGMNMVKRIDSLTPQQRARMHEWADQWISVGLRTGAADRPKFEKAAEQCYRAAGLPWHGNVVWVPSAIVMAIAAPVAALGIQLHRATNPGEAVRVAVSGAVDGAVRDAVDGAVSDAVDGAVSDAVRGAVSGAVDGGVRNAVRNAVSGAVRDAVRGAVDGAVRDAVDGAVSDAVCGAVRGPVRGAVLGAVRTAVRNAVSGAVDGGVRNAVDGAVRNAVDGGVRVAVRNAVRVAVDGGVRNAVDGAVDGGVRNAVDGAVDGAVGERQIAQAVADVISRGWPYYIGGQLWVGGWWWGPAYTSFFREVAGLELTDDLWQRGLAYEATTEAASWWYPHRDFIM